MLRLYHSPMACSLASRLALTAAEVPHEVVIVRTWKGEQKTDAYRAINPRGKVPALESSRGVLLENTAILQYVSDLAPEKSLMPAAGTFARATAQSWLSYFSSSLHVSMSAAMFPLSGCDGEACRKSALDRAIAVLTDIDSYLDGRTYVLDGPSVCDIYLSVFALWRAVPALSGQLPALPNVDHLQARTFEQTHFARVIAEDMKARTVV